MSKRHAPLGAVIIVSTAHSDMLITVNLPVDHQVSQAAVNV
ncbi:hypothetical protein [Pseudomonas eucalypticola]|nr:hypothetical protein [Pseudomonas eucalypticola]